MKKPPNLPSNNPTLQTLKHSILLSLTFILIFQSSFAYASVLEESDELEYQYDDSKLQYDPTTYADESVDAYISRSVLAVVS